MTKGGTEMNSVAMALSNDHPMMKAWKEFEATDEFKNALRWAVETKYDDGRLISPIQIEQHAKGAMWLAFTKGMDVTATQEETQRSQSMEQEYLLQFFAYEHLPPHLQEISKPFGELAKGIVVSLPKNPERTTALRKLLEAKDCAVRALLFK